MIRFNNDYNHGAFASILKELGATNSTSYAGYGEDEWCDKAETIIKKLVDDDDALIKFIPGATQANYRSEERRVGKECRSRWSPYH